VRGNALRRNEVLRCSLMSTTPSEDEDERYEAERIPSARTRVFRQMACGRSALDDGKLLAMGKE